MIVGIVCMMINADSNVGSSLLTSKTWEGMNQEIGEWIDHGIAEIFSPKRNLSPTKNELSLRPKVDIVKTNIYYKIIIDTPEVNPKDLKVTIEDHRLVIAGTKTRYYEEKNQKIHKRNCASREFRRVFTLPQDVDTRTIRAQFQPKDQGEPNRLYVTLDRTRSPVVRSKREIPIHVA